MCLLVQPAWPLWLQGRCCLSPGVLKGKSCENRLGGKTLRKIDDGGKKPRRDGSAIFWLSKQQEIIFLSITESKYITVMHSGKEAVWLHSLLSQIFGPFKNPTTLFSDNQSAIALTHDHQYHARIKHINVHYHWICWIIK
jgi:hypothetical protein